MLVGNAETGSVNFGGWNLDDCFLIYCYCKVKNMTEKKKSKNFKLYVLKGTKGRSRNFREGKGQIQMKISKKLKCRLFLPMICKHNNVRLSLLSQEIIVTYEISKISIYKENIIFQRQGKFQHFFKNPTFIFKLFD